MFQTLWLGILVVFGALDWHFGPYIQVEYRLVLCKNTFIVIIDIYHRLVFLFFYFHFSDSF